MIEIDRLNYLYFNKDFQKDLFQVAVQKAGKFSELGRKLGIGRKTISGCSKGCVSSSNLGKELFLDKRAIKKVRRGIYVLND